MNTDPEVLLINPCYNKSETLGPFARYISSQLPLSLGFLAGYLLARNISVQIIDEQLMQTDEVVLEALIARGRVRIVGISVLTLTSGRAYALGRRSRRDHAPGSAGILLQTRPLRPVPPG